MTTSTQNVSDFYSRFSASYTQYANGTSTLEETIDLKACKADHPFSWSDLQTWQALQESIDAIILEKEKSGESPFNCWTWVVAMEYGPSESQTIACNKISP